MLDNGLGRYYITSGVCVQPPLYVHPGSRIVQATGCEPQDASRRMRGTVFWQDTSLLAGCGVSERRAYVKTAFSVKNAHE